MDTLLKKIKEFFPEKFRENRRLVIIIAVIALLVLFCIISISKAVVLKNEAGVLKQDLKDVASSFRAMDLPDAKSDIKKMDSDLEHIQKEMDSGFWVFMSKMPVIGKDIKSAGILLDCASEASDTLLWPAALMLQKYPLSDIKGGKGLSEDAVNAYLDFCCSAMPVLSEMADSMSDVKLRFIDRDGKITSYIDTFIQAEEVFGPAAENILEPAAKVFKEDPPSKLRTENGIKVSAALKYIDLLEEIMPYAEEVMDGLSDFDMSALDKNGKISGYEDSISDIMNKYDDVKEYIPLLKAFLGNGGDKTYVFAAQNSSEIRASGGFPGSVGAVTIRKGTISLGEFHSVYDVMYDRVPSSVAITRDEITIFGSDLYLPWDADYIPDFPRVAEIWAAAYEEKNGVAVDGVISMTPVIIQDLLDIYGDITLSSGFVLNGENATKVLQYDIYAAFYPRGQYADKRTADSTFEETAKKTFELVTGASGSGVKTEAENFIKLFDVFKARTGDRTVMLWFKDAAEQKLCEKLHCDGALNHDKNNPEAGIYFSGANACKLGWWLDIDPEITEEGTDADGSKTYNVKTVFRNNVSWSDLSALSDYVVSYGSYISRIYLFAPAGGTISDLKYNGYCLTSPFEYNGLQLIYLSRSIGAGEEFTVTYRITTAPGVDSPLGISMTPTLQKYR